VDIVALTRGNADWDNISVHLHSTEATNPILVGYAQWSLENNRQENYEVDFQLGRMALIVLNQLCHWVQ